MLWSLVSFRSPVSRMTQVRCPRNLLTEQGIRHRIARRTAIQLSPYHAGLAGRHLQRLPVPPAFPTCSFPLRLSPSGQSDDPGATLRAPPDWVRDSTPRSAAHPFSASGSPVPGSLDQSGGHRAMSQALHRPHGPCSGLPAPLCHVAGFPDLGLLRGLRRPGGLPREAISHFVRERRSGRLQVPRSCP
jgi:hypothetical protein